MSCCIKDYRQTDTGNINSGKTIYILGTEVRVRPKDIHLRSTDGHRGLNMERSNYWALLSLKTKNLLRSFRALLKTNLRELSTRVELRLVITVHLLYVSTRSVLNVRVRPRFLTLSGWVRFTWFSPFPT